MHMYMYMYYIKHFQKQVRDIEQLQIFSNKVLSYHLQYCYLIFSDYTLVQEFYVYVYVLVTLLWYYL